MDISVSVIMAAHNESRHIAASLQALSEQDYEPLEVVVVDDGSRDGTAEIVARSPHSTLLRQSHQGPAIARNLGASVAKGDILVFVDADMICPPEFISRLVAPMIDDDAPGTFTKEIFVANPHRRWAVAHMLGRGLPRDRHFRDGFPDRWEIYRAVWRDRFEAVGGFDNVGYGEDVTLGRKLGVEAVAAPGASCRHFEPDTLLDIFRSARWFGRGERIQENPHWRDAYRPKRLVGYAWKLAVTHRKPSLFIYRVWWSMGVLYGSLTRNRGSKAK